MAGEEQKTTASSVLAFADVLRKLDAAQETSIVPTLKKIEAHTAILKKFKATARPWKKAVQGEVTQQKKSAKSASPQRPKRQQPSRRERQESTAVAERTGKTYGERIPLRNRNGRFVGRGRYDGTGQDIVPGQPKQHGILRTLAAFAGHKAKQGVFNKSDVIKEAAGRAVLGPMYDAVVNLKERYDGFKESRGNIRTEYAEFKESRGFVTGSKGGDAQNTFTKPIVDGFDEETSKIIDSLNKGESEDERRHKELVKAILSQDNRGGGASRKTGPGSRLREKAAKVAKDKLGKIPLPKIPKVSIPGLSGGSGGAGLAGTILPLLAKAGLVAGAGATGYGIGTLLNKGIEQTGEAITGKKGWSLGGQIYDWTHGDAASTFESGARKTPAQAAATISDGKGDAGGKSYGTYQLASNVGEVDKFLQKSGYAQQFQGLQVGSAEFDKRWKQAAAQDENFVVAQKQYAIDTKYNPQMMKLYGSGIDLSKKGRAVQEMVLSTANQYGGNSSVIQKALTGKDVASMADADIIGAVQGYKAANVGSNFRSSDVRVQAGVARRIQDEKAHLLALDAREKGTKTATAAAPPAIESQQIAIASPAQKKEAETATVAESASLQQQTTPTAYRNKGEGLAETGTGFPTRKGINLTSLAKGFAKGDFTEAKRMLPKADVTSLAKGTLTNPASMPERLTATANDARKQIGQQGQGIVQGGMDMGGSLMSTLGKLSESIGKMTGKDETEKQAGGPIIRTEFDDTMLTLMAYDRI